MKKIKLITSISSIGVIAAATPIIATSCSNNNNDSNLNISLQNNPTIAATEVKIFSLQIKYEGGQTLLKELTVTSKTANLITISDVDKDKCTFRATGINEGIAQIEVTATDLDNHKNTAIFDIEVIELDTKLEIIADVPTEIAKKQKAIFTVTAKYNDVDVAIEWCEVDSSDDEVLYGSYSNGLVTLTAETVGIAAIKLKVSDKKGHVNLKIFYIEVANTDSKLDIIVANVPTEIAKGLTATFTVTAKYDGADVNIKSCEVKSTNENVLSGTYANGTVTLTAKTPGTATITLNVTDENNHVNYKAVGTIEVTKTDTNLNIAVTDAPTIIPNGQTATFTVTAQYGGDDVNIGSCVVDSSDDNVISGTYNNDGTVTLTAKSIGTVSITLLVTDVNGHYNEKALDNDIEVTRTDDKLIITTADVPTSIPNGQTATFTVTTQYNGTDIDIGNCVVDSSDDNVISGTYNNDGTVTLTAKSIGTVSITLLVTDVNGHYNEKALDNDIEATRTDDKLIITTGTLPVIMANGWAETFTVTTQYEGSNVDIDTCEVVSSDDDIVSGTYTNGVVTLTANGVGTASIIKLLVTDVNGHYNEKELNADITIKECNTLKYNNYEYTILDNNNKPDLELDPNKFCTFDANDQIIAITLNVKTRDGNPEQITIDSESDLNLITEISFKSCVESVTGIGDSFLDSCTNLTSIDLSGLSAIETIGHAFLYQCWSLPDIDLSGLSNVTDIYDEFLYDCRALTSLNLEPLANVTDVGEDFLYGCISLSTLDFSTWEYVVEIGDRFLMACENLTTIKFGSAISASMLDDTSGVKSFGVDDTTCTAFTTGITLDAEDKVAIQEKFPESTSEEPYRHWAN